MSFPGTRHRPQIVPSHKSPLKIQITTKDVQTLQREVFRTRFEAEPDLLVVLTAFARVVVDDEGPPVIIDSVWLASVDCATVTSAVVVEVVAHGQISVPLDAVTYALCTKLVVERGIIFGASTVTCLMLCAASLVLTQRHVGRSVQYVSVGEDPNS